MTNRLVRVIPCALILSASSSLPALRAAENTPNPGEVVQLEAFYPYVVGMTRESQAASGFTLRGFTNNATNTLLNNIQFDGQSGGASRFGSPTTANVERVEVLKGPNSVLYGAMSPGGIINIV